MIARRTSYVERVAWMVFWAWSIAGSLALAANVIEWTTGTIIGRDATDGQTERSGLGLYTDHGTGCQYLSRSFSGITPRLSADGRPVCGGAH